MTESRHYHLVTLLNSMRSIEGVRHAHWKPNNLCGLRPDDSVEVRDVFSLSLTPSFQKSGGEKLLDKRFKDEAKKLGLDAASVALEIDDRKSEIDFPV